MGFSACVVEGARVWLGVSGESPTLPWQMPHLKPLKAFNG